MRDRYWARVLAGALVVSVLLAAFFVHPLALGGRVVLCLVAVLYLGYALYDELDK